MSKKKIAVLGGGTGSLSAVWGLTSLPDWQSRWEITVYQMGWRLGGKGASGRNPQTGQRIEEHGLHVWAGFYENAFRVMREVYEAADRQGGPVRTVDQAFLKHSDVIVEELVKGQWRSWPITFPTNSQVPGTGGLMPSIWSYIQMILELLADFFKRSKVSSRRPSFSDGGQEVRQLVRMLTGGQPEPTRSAEDRSLGQTLINFSIGALLEGAQALAQWMGVEVFRHTRLDQLRVISVLEAAFRKLEAEYFDRLDDDDDARHLYLLLDMGLGLVRGLIMDGVIFRGFDAIDTWDWPEWMRRWGVSDYSLSSVLVRGVFDYIFGYPKGDVDNPRVGAGTAIHGMLRLVFTYKGALFYEMQGGMGDVVFAPMYEALKKRGVEFKFFHKIEGLVVGADQASIQAIDLNVQATVRGGASYEPLIDVKGMPCWPSQPLYDQLDQGQQLRDANTNLEISWDPWPGVAQQRLTRGVDFDQIILGISLAGLQHTCRELMQAQERFKRMVYGIKTTQTQAVQLWMTPSAKELGAPLPPPVATAYVDPINTWADLSYLIKYEDWPSADEPKFLVYLCGPMEDPAYTPDFSDHDFPARELERVKSMARQWLGAYVGHIWPKSTTPQNPDGLDFSLLHGSGSGDERFEQQYFRANFEPTERYVLSVPGTTSLRMKAADTGFDGLFVAGDWTYTSISAGCIECAVMSGLHCAEAISGARLEIVDRGY